MTGQEGHDESQKKKPEGWTYWAEIMAMFVM